MLNRSFLALAGFGWLACSAQQFNIRNDFQGFGQPEVTWGIEELGGQLLIYSGNADTTNTGWRTGFTRLTLDGAVLSEFSFGSVDISYYPGWSNTIDAREGLGIGACGSLDSSTMDRAVVWRFNSTGDSLWAVRLFEQEGYESLGYAAHWVGDTAIAAVGMAVIPGSYAQVFLALLDTTGEVLWTRFYGGPNDDYGRSIDIAPEGSIYVGGDTRSYSGPDADDLLMKLDLDGDLLWMVTPGTSYDEASARVCATQDNGVVYVGASTEYMVGTLPYSRLLARRYSPSGSLLWTKKYGPVRNVHELWSVKALPTGDFISCGTLMGPEYPHGCLLKFNADGDSLWMRSYTHPSTDTTWSDWHDLRDVIATTNGGFAACGYLLSLGQDSWVIKVDSFGCLVPGCQQFDNIAEQGIDLNILAYPNPTQGRLFLSFRSARSPQGEFTLLNSAGQVVKRFQPGGASVEIDYDIGHHPSGMYLLRYEEQGVVRWSQKVIKE